jgi:hypothetical protein
MVLPYLLEIVWRNDPHADLLLDFLDGRDHLLFLPFCQDSITPRSISKKGLSGR